MKKYGKMIILILFSGIIIGSFYIKAATAENLGSEYTIETHSGDEKYIEELTLFGGSNNENTFHWEYVEIGLNQTKTSTDLSYGEQLDGLLALVPEMQKMYQEQRGFMRDKDHISSNYYEDENTLTYAEMHGEEYSGPINQIRIAVLDKATNQEEEYIVDIPQSDKDGYAYKDGYTYIEDIQKNNDEWILFIQNYLEVGFDQPVPVSEMNAYHIDLETKSVVKVQKIQSAAEKAPGAPLYSTNLLNHLTSKNDLLPERFLVFSSYPTPKLEGQTSGVEETSLLAYDMDSNEIKELAVPNELKQLASYPGIAIHESLVYFTQPTEEGFEVSLFNLETNRVEKNHHIRVSSEMIEYFIEQRGADGFLNHIDGNKIYYVSSNNYTPGQAVAIVVADLTTGQVLYEGTVEETSNNNETTLSISDITVSF